MISITAPVVVPPRVRNLRRLWLKTHRWTALSVGWLLALVGFVGALLIVGQPLDRIVHTELFRADGTTVVPPVALEAIRQQLVAEFGKASLRLRPPAPGETLAVNVTGKGWNGTVYLNPFTGREQGRRGELDGVVNILFKFHNTLFLPKTGRAILALLSISYLFLLVSGVVLWWPKRWPPLLRIELRKGQLRGLFDLHRTGGAVLGLVIAVSVATGTYIAWKPLGEGVSALAGVALVKAPKVPTLAAGEKPLSLDQLVAIGQAQFPGAPIAFIQVPGDGKQPMRFRFHVADDLHPKGLTQVWLHPVTGKVLGVTRWNQLDPGARAFSWVYPLHTGELGGPLLEAVLFIGGIAFGTLAVSGTWLWWRRCSIKSSRAG